MWLMCVKCKQNLCNFFYFVEKLRFNFIEMYAVIFFNRILIEMQLSILIDSIRKCVCKIDKKYYLSIYIDFFKLAHNLK